MEITEKDTPYVIIYDIMTEMSVNYSILYYYSTYMAFLLDVSPYMSIL